MYHSISFGDEGARVNTWEQWGLVPVSPPVVNPPVVDSTYVDIPYGSRLDYTEVLADQVQYKNRTGEWEFVLTRKRAAWAQVYSNILTRIHGKETRIVLDDDPNYFYVGRLNVEKREFGESYSKIIISYNLEPYKYPISSSLSQDWLWNDLFSNIIYYGTFDVSGNKQRNLINPSASAITPKFVCSAAMSVTKGNRTYNLPRGTTKNPGFTLASGDNVMTFSGTGRVEVDYSVGKSL